MLTPKITHSTTIIATFHFNRYKVVQTRNQVKNTIPNYLQSTEQIYLCYQQKQNKLIEVFPSK